MNIWKRILHWLRTPQTAPTASEQDTAWPVAAEASVPHRASFLFDNAGTRCMNALAPSYPTEQVEALITRMLRNGDNACYLFLANQGDGRPVPTTIYSDRYGGTVDHAAVAAMRARINLFRKANLRIIAWLTADDSPEQSHATAAQHIAHVRCCAGYFSDLVHEWVVGLEINEDGRGRHAKDMIATLHAISSHPVGIHLTTGHWQEAIATNADVLYYQFGFGKSAPQCVAEAKQILDEKHLNGRCKFVAAEYHKSSDSREAKTIGKALLKVPGVCGVGNGA